MAKMELNTEEKAAAYDAFRKVMIEVAYDAGWPADPKEHLELIQKEVQIALSQHSAYLQGHTLPATGARHPNLAGTTPSIEELIVLVDSYDHVLFEMGHDAGWPDDPAAHLKQMQAEIAAAQAKYRPLLLRLQAARRRVVAA